MHSLREGVQHELQTSSLKLSVQKVIGAQETRMNEGFELRNLILGMQERPRLSNERMEDWHVWQQRYLLRAPCAKLHNSIFTSRERYPSGPFLHDGVCRMCTLKLRLCHSATRVCMLPIQWVSTQIDVIGEWQLLGSSLPHSGFLPLSDVSFHESCLTSRVVCHSGCCLHRGEGGVFFDLPHSCVCRPHLHVCGRPSRIMILGSSDQSLHGHPLDCWDSWFPESLQQYPPATVFCESLFAPFCEPYSPVPCGGN